MFDPPTAPIPNRPQTTETRMGSQRHSTQDDILRDAEFLDPQSNQTPPPDEIRHPECNGDNKAPNISWRSVVHPPEGGIQLADEGGLQKGRYAPSETAQSESARSINVKDFGFSTAPCPLAPYYDLCGDDRSDKRILELISSTDRRRPSVDESEERLRAHIDNSLQGSRMDKKQYLPIDAFERIFTIDSILSVIRARSPTASSAELLKKVTRIIGEKADKSRRRIFGILVYMEELDYLDRFIEQGICDEDLPLRHSEPSMKCFTTRTCEEENSTLFQRWDRNHIQLFYVYQEMFLVPFFDFQHQRLPYYLLDPCIRLPWQALGDKTSGGFSIVRKLQIHPGHHNMGPSGPSQASHESMFFALKEVNFWNTESCDQELEAHERCRAVTQKEKHLTELLLAIRHGERLYLLFEWADDNLKEFWENNPQVETTPAVTRWVAQQCLGIARAIRRIHGYSTHHRKKRSSTPSVISDAEKDWGRHGDIKPNNILRFKAHREGRHLLVVSDLGLTRYHSRHTKSKVSRIEGCTDTYAAPEVELGYRISPRYDIWSLGCVYLEFCIWYLEGSEAVERFADERALHHESDIPGFQSESYYILTRDPRDGKQSAELNSVVGEWIRRLSDLPACTPFVQRMLELIRDEMLVISAKERSGIDRIYSAIADLISKLPPLQHSEGMFPEFDCEIKQEEGPDIKEEETETPPAPQAELVQHTMGNSSDADVSRRPLELSVPPSDGGSADEMPSNNNAAERAVLDDWTKTKPSSSFLYRRTI